MSVSVCVCVVISVRLISCSHFSREEFLNRARNGMKVVEYFERGGGNLAPHYALLDCLASRISLSEQGSYNVYASTKREKQIALIIFKFNKTLAASRDFGNAWVYAIACEAAAEFYEQIMMKPMARSHMEVKKNS